MLFRSGKKVSKIKIHYFSVVFSLIKIIVFIFVVAPNSIRMGFFLTHTMENIEIILPENMLKKADRKGAHSLSNIRG